MYMYMYMAVPCTGDPTTACILTVLCAALVGGVMSL